MQRDGGTENYQNKKYSQMGGGKLRVHGNLGSTSNYLGDYDDSNKFVPKEEKIAIINE